MELLIADSLTCWLCGSVRPLTGHHALPKMLHPMHNVIIPLCIECHTKIHRVNE